MAKQQQCFQDQEILTDMLTAQKQLTSSYNTFSTECSDAGLKNDMLDVFNDEQSIQTTVFQEMNKRGWYQTAPAEAKKVTQARTKFEGIAQQIC